MVMCTLNVVSFFHNVYLEAMGCARTCFPRGRRQIYFEFENVMSGQGVACLAKRISTHRRAKRR